MAVSRRDGKASAIDEHLRAARRLHQHGVAMPDIQQPDMQLTIGSAQGHGAHQNQRCRRVAIRPTETRVCRLTDCLNAFARLGGRAAYPMAPPISSKIKGLNQPSVKIDDYLGEWQVAKTRTTAIVQETKTRSAQ